MSVAGRRDAVWQLVNEVVDPCSVSMAVPLGIGDMGLVSEIKLTNRDVEVVLLPTSPHCMFVGLFEEEVAAKLSTLGWVESVRVRTDEGETIWEESRLTPRARDRLTRRRAALLSGLPAQEEGHGRKKSEAGSSSTAS